MCVSYNTRPNQKENAMRITRIDFEGKPGYYATATRRRDSDLIEFAILTPDMPNGRNGKIQADCEDDIYSLADGLHHALEGCKGTSGDIDEYHRALLKLGDC
jgi:hypothetical protein